MVILRAMILIVVLISTDICHGYEYKTNDFNCNDEIDVSTLTDTLSHIEDSAGVFDSLDNWGKEDVRGALIGKLYEDCLEQQLLLLEFDGLSVQDMGSFFRLLSGVYFYSHKDKVLAHLELLVVAKENKKIDVEREVIELYGHYITARDLDRAQKLAKKYPQLNLQQIPPIENYSKTPGRRIIKLTNDQQGLIQQYVEFPDGGFVVVSTISSCYRSSQMVKLIKQSSELKSIFAKNALFISAPDKNLALWPLEYFEKEMSPFSLNFSFSTDDWPEIRNWNSPVLYFYLDGKLKRQIAGWPEGGREDELRDALAAVGLLN